MFWFVVSAISASTAAFCAVDVAHTRHPGALVVGVLSAVNAAFAFRWHLEERNGGKRWRT